MLDFCPLVTPTSGRFRLDRYMLVYKALCTVCINHLGSIKCIAYVQFRIHLCWKLLHVFVKSDFRISLIRNGDRIPSHEQVVIQEYLDRVSTAGSICHQSNFSFVWFLCLFRPSYNFSLSFSRDSSLILEYMF